MPNEDTDVDFSKLIKELKSPYSMKIIDALAALGESGDVRSIEPIISVLENCSISGVRVSAVRALGKFKGARIDETLREALIDEEFSVRKATLKMLVLNKKAFTQFESLVGALHNEDADIRNFVAIVSLDELNDFRVIESLINLLEDKTERAKLHLEETLDKMRNDKRLLDFLIEKLKKGNSEVILSAIKILGFIGDKGAIEPLKTLVNHKNKKIREIVSLLIEKPEFLEQLQSKDRYKKREAAEALAQMGDRRGTEVLLEIFQESIYEVVFSNASDQFKFLINIGKKEQAMEIILRALKLSDFDDYEVDETLIDLIILSQDIDALIFSINYFGTYHDSLDQHIIDAILALDNRRQAIPSLNNFLACDDWKIQIPVLRALGKMRDASSIKPITELFFGSHSKVREAARGVIQQYMKYDSMELTFIEMLKEKNQQKRFNAAIILGSAGDKRAIPHLRTFIKDTRGNRNLIAIEALENLEALSDDDICIFLETNNTEQMNLAGYIELMAKVMSKYEERKESSTDDLVKLASDMQSLKPVLGEEFPDEKERIEVIKMFAKMKSEEAQTNLHDSKEMRNELLNLQNQEEAWEKTFDVIEKLAPEIQDEFYIHIYTECWSSLKEVYKKYGDLCVEPMIEALMNTYDDSYHNLKGSLIYSLGETGDKRAIEPLKTILWHFSPSPSLSQYAESALIKLGEKRVVVEELLNILKTKPVRYQHLSEVIERLGNLGDRRATVPLLELLPKSSLVGVEHRRLKDTLVGVEHVITKALGCLGDIRAYDALLSLLESETTPTHTRLESTIALGNLGDDRAINSILKVFAEVKEKSELDHYLYLPNNPVRALIQLGEKQVVKPLLALLQSDISAKLKTAIIEALAEKGEKQSVASLMTILESEKESEKLRSSAAEALGKLGDNKAYELMISLLQTDVLGLKTSVIKALGELGDKRAVKPLIKIVETRTDYPGISSSAVEALGKLGDEVAIDFLLILLQKASEGTMIRGNATMLAAEALGKLGDKRAVEPLLVLLQKDIFESTKIAVINALGELGDERAVEPLKTVLETEKEHHFQIRSEVSEAIRKLSDK